MEREWIEMSGIDEQYALLLSNNVFFEIYSSIRTDWTQEVDERTKWLLEILPYTSVKDKTGMRKHLRVMVHAWEIQESDVFDGRSWIRDCDFSYVYVGDWIVDWEYVTLLDTDGEEFEEILHEEAEAIYSLWKSRRLEYKRED